MKTFIGRKILGALLLASLCACGEWEYPEDKNLVAQEKPSDKSIPFAAQLVEHKEPNHFSVALSWRAVPQAESYVLRRKDQTGTETQFGPIGQNLLSYRDDTVVSGQRYTYELAVFHNSGLTQLASGEIRVPVDLEIKGRFLSETAEIVGIHRLFLAKNAELLSQGQNLNIEVRKILSDGGTIASFAEGQTAASGSAGRDGGQIRIRAMEAHGTLRIVARGENGAGGSNGVRGGRGPSGGRGSDGQTSFEYNCFRVPPHIYLPGNRCSRIRYCSKPPGNGSQGGRGVPGGRGANGFPGGDSAEVLLEVAKNSDFQVQYEIMPGRGGPGGAGGAGGPGGLGGAPGNSPSPCVSAVAGALGAAGAAGVNGSPGAPGNSSKVCIKIGTTKLGDC